MSFPDLELAPSPKAISRMKRQLAEQAVALATQGRWEEAAQTNRKLLELGPDAEAENRLAKALWELGHLAEARQHYQNALAIDPTNQIAARNIDRLKTLLIEAGEETVPARPGSKAPAGLFVEEAGKTGFAHLVDLPPRAVLAQANPGDLVELVPEGTRLAAVSNGVRIGVVEPRVAARLLRLIATGNRYLAGIVSINDHEVRIIIREVFQDPANYGKVSFPAATRITDLRPYTKGSLVREEEELEEELEEDVEDEEIEDLERVLPAEVTPEEAFEEEEAGELLEEEEEE